MKKIVLAATAALMLVTAACEDKTVVVPGDNVTVVKPDRDNPTYPDGSAK